MITGPTPAALYIDWIAHHARFRPERVALIDDAKAVRLTYRQLHTRVDALAAGLREAFAVGVGDRVVLLAKSCFEAFELQFACARLGAIFVPANWRLTAEELAWIVGDCDPRVVLHDAEFAHLVPEFRPRVAIEIAGSSAYERIAALAVAPLVSERLDAEAVWMILYTSGTTGRPKGAMLSYRMMHFNAVSWLGPSRITDRSVFLCSMPTFHTGGLNCYSNALFYAGGTVIVQRDYDAARALALLADPQLGISHFFGTPTHYLMLTDAPGFAETPLPALEIAGMGGAPSSTSLVANLLDRGLPMQPAYGMTEIGPAIFVTEMHDVRSKVGTCGHPTLHVEMKIADIDGRSCETGEAGELWVRGPVCMSGYWRNAEATQRAFEDGWFKTGDGARVDAQGYVYIVDRLKDMFISGGENIYPAEVERVLGDHPAVLMAAVIGVADAKWGEVGAAFVELRGGAQVDADALLAHCRDRLARYKIPKSFRIIEAMPKNASGKIAKRELREWL